MIWGSGIAVECAGTEANGRLPDPGAEGDDRWLCISHAIKRLKHGGSFNVLRSNAKHKCDADR